MHIVLMLLLWVTGLPVAEARIYHYIDDLGRKVYVDRLSAVPERFRDQLDIREEPAVPSLAPDTYLPPETDADSLSRVADTRRQLLSQREELRAGITALEMPVTIHQNRILAPIRVSYRGRSVALKLILDTGASVTVLHRTAIAALRAPYQRAGYVTVADGRRVRADRVTLDQVWLGPYEVPNVSTLVIDSRTPGMSGLLGMDFLLHARYEIDHARSLLVWEPKQHARLNRELKRTEAELKQLEGR